MLPKTMLSLKNFYQPYVKESHGTKPWNWAFQDSSCV